MYYLQILMNGSFSWLARRISRPRRLPVLRAAAETSAAPWRCQKK